MIAIDWKPSRQAALPLYRQIYLFIQSKIQSNQWTQGTILPPQRELANKLDVNRSTLTIAIEELIADGYLTSRQGSGIKVSGSAWAEITAGSRSWNERLSADALPVRIRFAESLFFFLFFLTSPSSQDCS